MNYNDEINRQIIFRSQQPTQVQEQNVGFGMNHFGQVIPIVTTQQHIQIFMKIGICLLKLKNTYLLQNILEKYIILQYIILQYIILI